MRIGIDYRILTVGPSAATRGMPRYTQQQLREVLASGSDDDYLLICDPRTDQSLVLPEIRHAPNVRIGLLPEAVTVDVHRDADLLAKAEVFESWLVAQELDVYHATTPFYLDQLLVAQHDACPYVATVYDLIPLIYPSQYLATAKLRQLYTLAAAMVTRATRLLAISESARHDASRYLGFPEDRIDIASPIAEPFFRPLAEQWVEAELRGLRQRLGLHESFILSVSDLHFTKNLETLLRGYSLLPSTMRAELPLVVACHLSTEHEAYLAKLAARLGVDGQILATGLVSDGELVSLYNGARFVVHPSRYEGFGLPVLEAMQCGTPVIATSCSSLPEVAGDAAILVDPDDAPAFAEAMQLLAEDPARREAMRERGLVRASAYTGATLAEATVAGYQAAAEAPAGPSRPRVAMWTPLPPLQTGVAEYAEQLLPLLQTSVDVELFVDDGYLPSLALVLDHPVRHRSAFDRLAAQFDAVIYQLGASVFHAYMEEPMRRHRGVAVLHDLVWSHLLHHRWAEQGHIDGFRAELLRLEGEDALAEYDGLDRSDANGWGERLRSFLDRHLMLGDVVTASRGQIVHFPAAVDELAARYPDASPWLVPMGVPGSPPGQPEVEAPLARVRLGIGPSTFVVGVFGVVDAVKQVDAAVIAFGELLGGHPDSLLLVVGPVLDPAYRDGLLELAADLGVLHAVRVTGHVPAAVFSDHLASTDVVVNLRWPSKKQMSAVVLRAAAAGKPVILSDLPEWDFLPATFCRRVPAGEADPVAVAAQLVELAADRQLRVELSTRARAYHQSEATVSRMAAGYIEVLERTRAREVDVAFRVTGRREATAVRRSTPDVNLNKVCEIEDFADAELAAVMRDVFSYKLPHMPPGYPRGCEYRKDWEIAMAVRALRTCGALRPDAVILGVGAGREDTAFYLTRHVARVVATDRYLAPGEWSEVAPAAMLVDPAGVAPYDFDQSRLVVQHMDGRRLGFDDETFDGVFSSGSIEHFGDLEDIASAAYEMGRVLKPGGVLSVSTEMLLIGPPGGRGLPGTVLFSPQELQRYVIDASGLEPVDELRLEISRPTLSSQRDLAHAIRQREVLVGGDHGRASWPGDPGMDAPHLVVVSDGYVFASVHLALRKGARYPATPNQWARPPASVLRAIEEDNRRILAAQYAAVDSPPRPVGVPDERPIPQPVPDSWPGREALARRLAAEAGPRHDAVADATSRILGLQELVDAKFAQVQREEELTARLRADVESVLADATSLPDRIEELAFEPSNGAGRAPGGSQPTGWRWWPVTLSDGLGFGVMVDPAAKDEVTAARLAADPAEWTDALLLLDVVRPGDVVVDVEARSGLFTLAAAATGCRVLAVEPSPERADVLRASVARNGFTDVHVVNAAVDGGQVTADALLQELGLGPVALVRIDVDVESRGVEILRGMAGVVGAPAPPPVLVMAGTRTGDLLRELEGLGFEGFAMEPGRLVRIFSGETGADAVLDYLAVKGSLDRLEGWRSENTLPIDETAGTRR